MNVFTVDLQVHDCFMFYFSSAQADELYERHNYPINIY